MFYLLVGFAIANSSVSISLLFLSGLLKISPAASTLFFDLTLLSLVIYVMGRIFSFFRYGVINGKMLILNAILICIFSYVLGSLFFSSVPWLYQIQSSVFIVTLYLPLSFLLINNLDRSNIVRQLNFFMKAVLIISTAWCGLGLHNMLFKIKLTQVENQEALVYHASAFGENYMYFSTFVVLLVIYAYSQIAFKRHQILLNGFILMVSLFLLVNSPARGLSLGLVIALFFLSIPLLKTIRLGPLLFSFFFIGLIVSAVIIYLSYFITEHQQESLNRLLDFTTGGKSVSHRIASVMTGFSAWSQSPISVLLGLGPDAVAYLNKDPGLYAHNIILEAILEYGIIGSISILLYFFMSFYLAIKILPVAVHSKSDPLIWLVGVYFAIYVFGMFSGTLGNSRLLWILVAQIYFVSINLNFVKSTLSKSEDNKEK